MNLKRLLLLGVVLPAAAAEGCASTAYAPADANRTYFTIRSGQWHLTRAERSVDLEGHFAPVVDCDPAARQSAVLGEMKLSSARDLGVASRILAGTIFGTVMVPILLAVETHERRLGWALAVDALNRSNAAAECGGGPMSSAQR